jgi:hypothetical protein
VSAPACGALGCAREHNHHGAHDSAPGGRAFRRRDGSLTHRWYTNPTFGVGHGFECFGCVADDDAELARRDVRVGGGS